VVAKKKDYTVASAAESRTWMQEEDLRAICHAWERYTGDVTVFESAVGALLVGRLIGYDGLRVLHSWRTLRNYEDLLGLEGGFKSVLKTRTSDSRRLNGVRRADTFAAFWKALGAGVASEPDAKVAVSE
jgi:hypothetical protein